MHLGPPRLTSGAHGQLVQPSAPRICGTQARDAERHRRNYGRRPGAPHHAAWRVCRAVGRIGGMPTNLSIQTLLGDVVGSTGHRYAAKDSAGNTMDTVKIITNPAGGYLGVYHTGNRVNLASSTDLVNWVFRRTLDAQASHPTICALPTGGFLTAAEFNDLAGSGGLLRFRHYANLSALLAGTVNRERTIPRSLSGCNEGTPNLYSVSLTPDIDHSIIDVGFHFQRNCDLDRQARGRLTNFTAWTAAADIGADGRLTSAAAVKGRVVNGNIGDRDTAMFDDVRYTLYEVQYVKGDFGSWRLYLDNWQTGTAAYLPVTTHGGSTTFANPTFATITSPAGKPAIVATVFVPSEGAAPGEAGQLVYYREYVTLPTPTAGLSATYFDNLNFTGSTLVRTDPRIDVDFGVGPPSANLGADQFAVRWTGQVLADRTDTYTFYTQTDDGAPALGQRRPAGQRLDRPRHRGEPRQHPVDRRTEIRPGDGVLRQRRRGVRPVAVVQPPDAQGGGTGRSPVPAHQRAHR